MEIGFHFPHRRRDIEPLRDYIKSPPQRFYEEPRDFPEREGISFSSEVPYGLPEEIEITSDSYRTVEDFLVGQFFKSLKQKVRVGKDYREEELMRAYSSFTQKEIDRLSIQKDMFRLASISAYLGDQNFHGLPTLLN